MSIIKQELIDLVDKLAVTEHVPFDQALAERQLNTLQEYAAQSDHRQTIRSSAVGCV